MEDGEMMVRLKLQFYGFWADRAQFGSEVSISHRQNIRPETRCSYVTQTNLWKLKDEEKIEIQHGSVQHLQENCQDLLLTCF